MATLRSYWVWTYGTHSTAVAEEFANIHREPIADLPLPYKRMYLQAFRQFEDPEQLTVSFQAMIYPQAK